MENYKNDVIRLQREVFSYLKNESNLSEKTILNFTPILMDEACIFRFYKKTQYSFAETKEAIIDHLTWMLNENVLNNTFDSFELNTNAYNYLLNGFIYFCGHDKMGRPLGIINLNHYNGNGDIEGLKKYMIFILELAQKLIREINLKNPNSIENAFVNNKEDTDSWDIQTQFSIILDLDNLKMSTLNYEIFPTLIKIFINHYPYIAETVYILNYRWIHAGLWGMVKQMLSESITKNMIFLKKNEIFDYIDPDQLLVEFGGNNNYKYNCHTCKLFKKYRGKQNLTTIPLHLLPSKESKVEVPKFDEHDTEDKWYDACSDENEVEEITEEIIQKPIRVPSSMPSMPYNNTPSLKNETIYPIKESNYLCEDDPVLNISYHPIKLSIKEHNNTNNSNQKVVKKSPLTVKYIIYGIIRHILMPFYAYVRRVRCTSVYFELILSRWIKKFSDENDIPPSFNYLSFFITNTTNMSRTTGQNNNESSDISQTTDASSSVTSTTLVSPSAMNYMNDQASTYSAYPSSPLNPTPTSERPSSSSTPSSLFDKSNNGSLSWEDINSLVQHTLRTCLPEYYNPLKDSVAILFFFASMTLLTHLVYPRNRYRLYSNFWSNLYKFRREIYVWLGLRPNTSKSIIQVI